MPRRSVARHTDKPVPELINIEGLGEVPQYLRSKKADLELTGFFLRMCDGTLAADTIPDNAPNFGLVSTQNAYKLVKQALRSATAEFDIQPPLLEGGKGQRPIKRSITGGALLNLLEVEGISNNDALSGEYLRRYIQGDPVPVDQVEIDMEYASKIIDLIRDRHTNTSDPYKLDTEAQNRYTEVSAKAYSSDSRRVTIVFAANKSEAAKTDTPADPGLDRRALIASLDAGSLELAAAMFIYSGEGYSDEFWQDIAACNGDLNELMGVIAEDPCLSQYDMTRFNMIADDIGFKKIKKPVYHPAGML